MLRSALRIRVTMIGFVLSVICATPLLICLFYFPTYYLFMQLPMRGVVNSCGPAKYVAGVAPFAAVSLGVYFFAGVRKGVKKKVLLPGAVVSMMLLFGPVMCLYAKVEFLSLLHGRELRGVEGSNFDDGSEGEIVFMKVFDYGDYKVKAFAVVCAPPGGTPHGCEGGYYFYERNSAAVKWEYVTDESLWGGYGDGDPPWPPY